MAEALKLAVLADCHIHPGKVDWPKGALKALDGVDMIVTLGDMGESSGLDALAAIAPVSGVRGGDDVDDPRTAPRARKLELQGVAIGCVFDPVRAGLVTREEGLALTEGFADAATSLFGGRIDVLLCASTHQSAEARLDGVLVVDPGSLTLPADETPTFALLTLEAGRCDARIIRL
jgi:putative phosphoesterase